MATWEPGLNSACGAVSDASGAAQQRHLHPRARVAIRDVEAARPYWITRQNVFLLIHELIALGHADAAVYCAILHATALDTTDVACLTAAHIERNSTLWMAHSTSDKPDIRYRYIMMHR